MENKILMQAIRVKCSKLNDFQMGLLMQENSKLTTDTLNKLMTHLQGWERVESREAIRKTFYFSDFIEAWGFMSRVALIAERLNHHPEWSNTYHRVEIVLTTHDCEGLSSLDIQFAQEIDKL